MILRQSSSEMDLILETDKTKTAVAPVLALKTYWGVDV
jgi:hypothetical protein